MLQFSNFEPAVRHSLVAISSLYEDFHCGGKSVIQLPTNTFALRHYNAAIENLRKLDNEPLILLVCVLFVCIEVLQGNREIAIQHSHHGITILDRIGTAYPWIVEHLSPIFRRLCVFPLFFGKPVDSYPTLRGLDDPIPATFVSLAEAQYVMDAIILRAARLTRRGDLYRYGKLCSQDVLPKLVAQQSDLQNTIEDWYKAFRNLSDRLDVRDSEKPAYYNLMSRYKMARMWTHAAFVTGECYYDDFLDDLKEVIDNAYEQSSSTATSSPSSSPGRSSPVPTRPTFSFEIGHIPLVIFAIMKCRDLRTRVRGLNYLRGCGTSRENMWEAERMYPICKRQVEIEHEITLDRDNQPIGPVAWGSMPTEVMRAKDFSSSPDVILQMDASGSKVWGSMAYYSMRAAEGNIWTRNEFIPGPTPLNSYCEPEIPMRKCVWEQPQTNIPTNPSSYLIALDGMHDIVLV